MMNWKGGGRKRSWPNFRYNPSICLEGLRKSTKRISQDSRSPVRDLNPGYPAYEAGVLTTRPRRSMRSAVMTDSRVWYHSQEVQVASQKRV
jgi:hypothetical protein